MVPVPIKKRGTVPCTKVPRYCPPLCNYTAALRGFA